MEIKFHGHACFSIREGKVTVVTDPYHPEIGFKLPALSADVVLSSHDHPDYNNIGGVAGNPKFFNWPGEYETLDIYFKGIPAFHDSSQSEEQRENTVFVMHMNGVRFCHLGALGTRLTSEQMEQVGEVDVLFVPIGGKDSIDAKKAKEVIEQMEPRVIIPMMYDTEGSKRGLDGLPAFLSLMGATQVQPLPAFVFKKSELPEDSSKVVVLEAA